MSRPIRKSVVSIPIHSCPWNFLYFPQQFSPLLCWNILCCLSIFSEQILDEYSTSLGQGYVYNLFPPLNIKVISASLCDIVNGVIVKLRLGHKSVIALHKIWDVIGYPCPNSVYIISVIRKNNDPRLWELEVQSAYVSLSFLRRIDENNNETWTSLNHISLYIYIYTSKNYIPYPQIYRRNLFRIYPPGKKRAYIQGSNT